MIDNFMIISYFLAITYGPFVLFFISLYFLLRGHAKSSSRWIFISFLIFFPDLLGLLFVELEPILYVFWLLPVIQVLLYIKFKKKPTELQDI